MIQMDFNKKIKKLLITHLVMLITNEILYKFEGINFNLT